jgi:hypothetical protein
MKKIVQSLGRTTLAPSSSIPLDLQNLPEGNWYVTNLVLRFTATAGEGGDVTGNSLKAAIGSIYLRTGEHSWINGLNVNDLGHLAIVAGNFYDDFNDVDAGTTADRFVNIGFRFAQLKDPLDLCPNVAQFKPNTTVIFNTGSFDANLTSLAVEVIAFCIDRKNVYVAPQLKLDKQVITTSRAGYIKVSETCIGAWMEFNGAEVLGTRGTLYVNGEPVIVNQPLRFLDNYDQLPFAAYGEDPYADRAVDLFKQIGSVSLESPVLSANSSIAYKDFDATAVPFRFVSIGVVPVRTQGGTPIVASPVAPLKI